MKRAFLLVLALGFTLACTPAEQPKPTTPENPTKPTTPTQPEQPTAFAFSATPSTLNFQGDGGTSKFRLTTLAQWKAYSQDDWYTFSPTSGEGDTEITVVAKANPDTQYGQRGTIDFEAQNGKGSLSFQLTQEKGQPGISVSVSTDGIGEITTTSATVSASYSGAPSVGVYDRGVYYGTSATLLNKQAGINSAEAASGSFTVPLSSLEPGTTYYVKAYVTAWDEKTSTYLDFFGEVKSFTTESGGDQPGGGSSSGLQYLGGYEIPAIDLQNTSACSGSGKETYGSTKWYNYLTNNSNQMVVTHTYSYNNKQYRNYTCLVDKTKKAPLWSAFVMHKNAYPDNNVGRTGSWTDDPGIPSGWQQSSSTGGYSRGHFVASAYRQATGDANKQTFYKTNQALQEQNGFNGALWASLENAVIANAPTGRDTLYVVVGVLYEDNKTLGGVPCPSHFYKLLMKCSFGTDGAMTAAKGCAYLYTNEAHSGNYSQGLTTIDAVEQRSGWDFFANVPKDMQDAAERQSASVW